MGKIILYKLLMGIWSAVLSSNMYVADTSVTKVVSVEVEAVKMVDKEDEAMTEEVESEEIRMENEIKKEYDSEYSEEKENQREKPDVSEEPQMYKKWARISDEWKEIFENEEMYPENLLDNLKRNPEILDFVYGYLDASLKPAGGMTIEEKMSDCPLFIQWDPRWGYVPYGSYNIGISGCGPTCLSMVLYNFLQNETITPVALSKKAMDEGYYVKNAGTAWTFLVSVPEEYGLSVTQHSSLDENEMVKCLENNGLMICSMSPGDFTDTGHFIVIRGYEDGEFTVNDPFSYTNSYKTWNYETLAKQTKQVWCYSYNPENHEEEFTSGE